MKWIVYLLTTLYLANLISAATIYGTIYDISLDKMENVVVEIDTEPKQQFISKNGTYIFDVPIGEYTIEVNHYVDSLVESSSKEKISVKNEGNFVLDLILFPAVDSELVGVDDISLDDDYFKERADYPLIILIAIVIIFIFLIFYFGKRKRPIVQEVTESRGDYYDKVFSIIKENKRVTQKEIRKQIPLSEAKISLIITELEHKGLIEKIKKGRGNIIILGR